MRDGLQMWGKSMMDRYKVDIRIESS